MGGRNSKSRFGEILMRGWKIYKWCSIKLTLGFRAFGVTVVSGKYTRKNNSAEKFLINLFEYEFIEKSLKRCEISWIADKLIRVRGGRNVVFRVPVGVKSVCAVSRNSLRGQKVELTVSKSRHSRNLVKTRHFEFLPPCSSIFLIFFPAELFFSSIFFRNRLVSKTPKTRY